MPNPKFRRFGVALVFLLASVALSFFIFRLEMPPTGYVDVNYDGMSTSGVFWQLENRSTQAIYMQGADNKIWPNWATTKCRTADYSAEGSDPGYLADGAPSIIKVSPGERIRLEVDTNLPNKYKGGHCRVRLALAGGTFIESHDFTPR